MKRLSIESVIDMHRALVQETGGMDGVRDMNLLDASVNSPYHTFDGIYLYPTLQAKAAHLAFSLIKNHPFLDGNKRIGILAMLVFLDSNGLPITTADEDLISLGLGLAENTIDESVLVDWIITHT